MILEEVVFTEYQTQVSGQNVVIEIRRVPQFQFESSNIYDKLYQVLIEIIKSSKFYMTRQPLTFH